MAFDFSTVTATETTMTARKTGRVPAENPFLTNNWVLDSYQNDRAMQVEVPGTFVDYLRTGKQAGPAVKLDGEAVSAVTMIRKAAEALQIGVRIETVVHPKRKGIIVIKFLGVDRKKTKKNTDEEFPTGDEATE